MDKGDVNVIIRCRNIPNKAVHDIVLEAEEDLLEIYNI